MCGASSKDYHRSGSVTLRVACCSPEYVILCFLFCRIFSPPKMGYTLDTEEMCCVFRFSTSRTVNAAFFFLQIGQGTIATANRLRQLPTSNTKYRLFKFQKQIISKATFHFMKILKFVFIPL